MLNDQLANLVQVFSECFELDKFDWDVLNYAVVLQSKIQRREEKSTGGWRRQIKLSRKDQLC